MNVKWIKITVDMFNNAKIKYLRKLPQGDSIVLIWIMLLTMAGRCNAGGMIFLTDTIPYTTKMMADELGFDESVITLALKALQQLGMIAAGDAGFIEVSGWAEHQNIDGMDRIREQNRTRWKRWNERKKLAAANGSSNVSVTLANATDIDIDKEKEKEYISIVEHLNQKAGTHYKPTTPKTKAAIHARLAEGFTAQDFETVIDKKCAEWLGTEWEKFLRPETLFGTKFESYLNAKNGKGNQDGNTDNSPAAKIGTWL